MSDSERERVHPTVTIPVQLEGVKEIGQVPIQIGGLGYRVDVYIVEHHPGSDLVRIFYSEDGIEIRSLG